MFPRDLRRLFEIVEPRSALVEAEGELPASFELLVDADDVGAALPKFDSEGTIRETPSRFESSGGFRVKEKRADELHEIRLVEERDFGGYIVEGSHLISAKAEIATLLSSTEGVRELVGSVLDATSKRLGTEVDIEVETHDADREMRGDRTVVDTGYVVRLSGLDGLAETERGRRMRVEEANVTLSRGDELTCLWEFDLRHHGRLFAELIADSGYGAAKEIRAARSRSGFSMNVDWLAELSDRGLSAEVNYETENAWRYVEELERLGAKAPAETEFIFELDARGPKTATSFDFETDCDPTTGFGDRLEAWASFLPLPVAPLVLFLYSS